MEYKEKVEKVLQKHYNYAKEENKKIYEEIAKDLNIKLTIRNNDCNEYWKEKIKQQEEKKIKETKRDYTSKKLYGEPVIVVEDEMLNISEGLLEDIRHELASMDKWYAFEPTHYINLEKEEYTIINNKDYLIQLNYKNLIKKIDKVLK